MKILLFTFLIIGSLFSKAQTLDSVWAEIKFLEIKHPEIVMRQATWESGWFKCTRCSLRYNNLFGFRSKNNATSDNPLGYLKFDSWCESVLYYRDWQDRKYNGKEDYYTFLVRVGYAEDPDYIVNLKSLKINLT